MSNSRARKGHCLDAALQRLARTWDGLIAPGSSVKDPVLRREARLLASFLVMILALFGCYHTIDLVFFAGSSLSWPVLIGYLILGGAYALSRTRLHQWGAVVTVSAFILVNYSAILQGDNNPPLVLIFFIPGLLLGSIFFSLRGILVLGTVNVIVIALISIEVHRGRVWVEPEGARQGSTFCFTLLAAPGNVCENRDGETGSGVCIDHLRVEYGLDEGKRP